MALKSELHLHENHNRLYKEQDCILTQFPPFLELLQSVFWRRNIGDDQGLYTSGHKTTQPQQGRTP